MTENQDLQVEDDPSVLAQLTKDMGAAPELYRPTNYWSLYEDKTVPELKQRGLHDFRRREGSALATFGATDVSRTHSIVNLKGIRYLYNRYTHKIPLWEPALVRLGGFLSRRLPILEGVYNLDAESAIRIAFELGRAYGADAGAVPLEEIGVSRKGNPKDILTIGANSYTLKFIENYVRYAYCCRFLDFANVKVLVELSPGSGTQIEIFHKAHPHVTLLLFDISPQLYVSQQYLKAVFPGDVVDYGRCRDLDSLGGLEHGKIHMMGAWQLPLIADLGADLFVSSYSLCEMEPHVVANYLAIVNQSTKAAMLIQSAGGKGVARRKGLPGVLKKTVFSDYQSALGALALTDRSPNRTILGLESSDDAAFWTRRPITA